MDQHDIDKLKNLLARSTPGQWFRGDVVWGNELEVRAGTDDPHGGRHVCSVNEDPEDMAMSRGFYGSDQEPEERDAIADLDLICLTHNLLPDLLAERNRMEQEIGTLRTRRMIDKRLKVKVGRPVDSGRCTSKSVKDAIRFLYRSTPKRAITERNVAQKIGCSVINLQKWLQSRRSKWKDVKLWR